MATGPCGEQFKAAFSCFMFSEADPKGMDCVDKFKDMQNCFREYPEVYGSELEPDEDDDVTGDDDKDLAALEETPESAPSEKLEESKLAAERRQQKQHEPQKDQSRDVTEQRKKEQALSGSDQVIPQAAHDDKTTNEGKKVDQEKKFNEVKEQ
ncbi:hypothetical protein K504DRAFT_461802 [Pleomassaria siparia CBS 279.74]|uniref:Mitochondrial intermembrane space import and assembly protein 40 n=1 Tax=Pleomassaria siparia CBS 279.74 TaxID=1314801 RepID=A0A6G1KKD2_9PLEO|nr:hypothetical protein K504DRAFT_461802 [Pleomassaria siparia CBS 279.74]